MIEWSKVTTGKCRRLADVPKDAQIRTVNGRECIGGCEVCGEPILDGQQYNYDSDGVMWHGRCPRTVNTQISGGTPSAESDC